MKTHPDILAAQQAYAARPYSARWEGSHIGSTQRFDTAAEAVAYLFQAVRVTREWIAEAKASGDGSWIALDLRRSYVDLGDGPIPARYVVMLDDLRSH